MDYVILVAETSRKDPDFTKIFPSKEVNTPGPPNYSKIHDWSNVKSGTIGKNRKVTSTAAIFEA